MTRKSDPLFASTVRKPSRTSISRRATVPCLTILAHCDVSRIGERASLKALMVGQTVDVSRVSPPFAAPGATTGIPLSDPELSRSPLTLRAVGSSIEIDPKGLAIRVEGQALDTRRVFHSDQLNLGLVIEIGERVSLLLHQCTSRPLSDIAGLLGQSDGIEDMRRELLRVADLDTPVLLRGETGTGKEQIAQAIHARSKRSTGGYIAVNMATVPESVAVSTLFGHGKGAFTGAQQRHRGLFERASGGTLMLDEIGETPESVQPMLLRAVETGQILPLGDEVERPVDVRFIAATDSDLERELRSRSFSAALLHRLAGYEIHTVPLRQRREDIPVLLLHFMRVELAIVNESERIADLVELLTTSGFMARLVRHPLPGNVRQLRNVARHLVISNRGQERPVITTAVEHQLRNELVPSMESYPESQSQVPPSGREDTEPSIRPSDIDDDTLIKALRESGWSPNRAAASLGIPTGTLHDLMRKSGKVRRAADLSDDELRSAAQASGGDTEAMADRLCVSERGLRITLRQRGMLELE